MTTEQRKISSGRRSNFPSEAPTFVVWSTSLGGVQGKSDDEYKIDAVNKDRIGCIHVDDIFCWIILVEVDVRRFDGIWHVSSTKGARKIDRMQAAIEYDGWALNCE